MNHFVKYFPIIIVLSLSVLLIVNSLLVTSLIPVYQRLNRKSRFGIASSFHQKSKFATSSSSSLSTSSTVLFQQKQEPLGFFQDFFKTKSTTTTSKTSNNRRKLTFYEKEQILQLKQSIVFACDNEQTIDRTNLETLLEEISILSPIIQPAYSSEINKKWIVLYTTEKEINFFLNNNLASSVDQTINTISKTISNRIPFTFATSTGSGLYVDGTISPAVKNNDNNDDNDFIEGIRTNFQFTSARLEIGFIKLQLPPIGAGWFDTIYLDDDFRIDVNSRNDILICIPSSD